VIGAVDDKTLTHRHPQAAEVEEIASPGSISSRGRRW
jgi:hypothetical protein